jgi:hypothetical protein
MTRDARREALAALTELSDMAPDVRIGQLVAHLGILSADEGGHDLGDIEDSNLLKVIDRHRGELSELMPNAISSLGRLCIPDGFTLEATDV